MDYKKIYEEWLNNEFFDEKTRKELKAIENDEKEIEDRFYKNLEFGTAGLRGKLGAGTNRMNVYNVSKVTQGIADFIIEKGQEYMNRGVAIAYDCRHYSKEFAKTAALVLAGNGIKAYLFEDLRPTPELSYTVRSLETAAGIIITASHNPKEYNGYKVYWEDGAQVLSSIADPMTEKINAINSFKEVKTIDEKEASDKGLLVILGKDMDYEYIEKVKTLSIRDDIDKNIKVVYSPLNGTGNIPVRRVLSERGFSNIIVVPEQENPDPNFTTVEYPNPENTKAFEYAERLGKEVNAELLLATDPDCDRLAIEVRNSSGQYVPFNGNQTGAILIKYIVESMHEMGTLPENAAIIKSLVTGDLGRAIAKEYGVTTFEVLTGFKNIYGKAVELEKTGEYKFIFGYEESIGYNAGTFVRDKDAVCSAMLLCEAAAYYKTKGKTLLDVLNEIFEKHGYYKEKQISLVLEGVEGKARIDRMMETYRKDFPKQIGNLKMSRYIDYLKGYEDISPSNVLKFYLADGSWYAIRPSGTEPKIKVYIYTKGNTLEESNKNLEVIEEIVINNLNSIE
ncbi:phospho-sugar mutase [Clostridium ganghwense]|uniref:Phosphoglucomutase n=1 Tax=Clostridium ganghwense TaxID=312089 RepID=A0ABT4CQU1_9CLOT|nr:phospho-sugar mutase [Clostridium ganghwense]MCY6371420.1 phospho-sugar mutase [Clostridium ganghwense]